MFFFLGIVACLCLGFIFRFPRPMWSAVETRHDQNDAREFDVSGGSKSTLSEADTEDNNVAVTQTDKSGKYLVLFLKLVFEIKKMAY